MPLPDKAARDPRFAATAILMALGLKPENINDLRGDYEALGAISSVSHTMMEAMRADHAARLGDNEQLASALEEMITLGAVCLLGLAEVREGEPA